MPNSLFVSCAEPSGDRLAADVIRAVQRALPDLHIYGCCGPRLRSLGAESVVDMETVAVMGVTAVLQRVRPLLQARRRLRAKLTEGPDLALFVDGPSLHLPLAREARKRGVTTVGLVCPQVWAWKPERTTEIAKAYAHLWCLFDFEPPLMQAAAAVHDCVVRHVGHPVLDRLPDASQRQRSPTALFGLAPGSRQQELERHIKPFLEAAHHVRRTHPGAHFLWAGTAPDALPDWIRPVPSIVDLQPCHAVLSKSGTVTLELAWMGVPQVVAHAVSPLTHAVGRMLVRHVDHIALPNVLNRQAVVPEFVGALQPATLAHALVQAADQTAPPLPHVGSRGATTRMADALVELLPSTGPLRSSRLPGAP